MNQELQALGDAVGRVSKGVPQALIATLPRSLYVSLAGLAVAGADAQSSAGAGEEEEQCVQHFDLELSLAECGFPCECFVSNGCCWKQGCVLIAQHLTIE